MDRTIWRMGAALILMLFVALAAAPARAEEPRPSVTDLQITGATVSPSRGTATVFGMVTCSTAVELDVYGTVRQGNGAIKHLVLASGGMDLACGPTPASFQIEVTTHDESDKLTPAPASINVFAECGGLPDCDMGQDRRMRLNVERP